MTKVSAIFLTLIAIITVFVLYLFGQYNSFVQKSENIDNAWAQVETQYQRRYDLIPNLVNSVKGAMKQEQQIFGQLAEARSRYAGAATASDKVEAANQVESAFGRLLVILENYPDLKSSATVQTLMAQLEGTENRVSVERGRYNQAVKQYNLSIKQLPGRLIAPFFGYFKRPYFTANPKTQTAPAVQL